MIETIEFQGERYPKFQSEGFAAQFAFPFADKVCIGNGVDVGCNREEWMLPASNFRSVVGIDPLINTSLSALEFGSLKDLDFIFSSHCLEHVDSWVDVLDYWRSKLRSGGTLFLYLPHYDQNYWRPWNNRKHRNIFTPHIIRDYLEQAGYKNIFVSERDLNHSFMSMAEKL